VNIKEYISSGIVEAFVLGLASEAEVAEVVQLRSQYPELDDAILTFEQAIEKQHRAQAITPPPRVKDRLFAALEESFVAPLVSQEETNDPEIIEEISTPVVPIKSRRWVNFAAAAATILFLANALVSIMLYRNYETLKKDYATLQQENSQEKLRFNSLYADVFKMQDTKMKKVPMAGVPGKEGNLATVYWNTETGEVYLFKNNLPAAEKGKQYQLWAIVDGKPVDAGVLDPNCEAFCKLKDIQNPQAFAITLEKEGGSPEPTMDAMFVMGGI